MKRLPAVICLFLLSLGLLAGYSRVQAQDTTQFSVPVAADQVVVTPAPINLTGGISDADFTTQMDALKVTYRNQLGIYRTNEKSFQIAKDQYYQIQTLAALEEAVRATRQVMLSRADVIQTYFTMAKLTLGNTKGIETDVKTKTLQDLDTLSTDLKVHRAAVAAASDRTGLLAVATEFDGLGDRVNSLSTSISYLVAYGRLQTVSDKTSTIKQELLQQIEQAETDPLKLAEKKRGLEEVQRNLDQVNSPLLKIRTALNPKTATNSQINSNTMANDFSDIYSGLSRSLSYLQELVKK